MRLSTTVSIGLFVISAVSCAYSVTVVNNNLDTGVPEITQDTDQIEISIKDDESKILEGITATDSKDGDVTDSLVVESFSNFIELGVRKASIVAFDSDNHIARVNREVVYTDYESPKFSMDEPLQCSIDMVYNYTGTLRVTDCLDGNITNKMHITFDQEYTGDDEEVKVIYSVSNSVGETVSLPATISIYDPSDEGQRPAITLNKYLIYAKQGETIDPMNYLYSVYINGRTYKLKNGQMVQTGVGPTQTADVLDSKRLAIEVGENRNGVYEIKYTVTDFRDEEDDTDDRQKIVRLIVVTEE